jgi:predicted transcriptional regulator
VGQPRQQATSLKLDQEIRDRIGRLAAARRRTAHWIMREAIQEYVTREEKREQFRADAEVAWADYQATGLHATGQEVDRWLSRLEDGEDAAPPECHR